MIIIITTHLSCSVASACLPPAALQGYVLHLLLYGLAAAVTADASVLICCFCLLDTTGAGPDLAESH